MLMSPGPPIIRLGELFHEIAPPIDYSLTPRWVVFAICFAVITIISLIVWWWMRRPRRIIPPKLPRERAMEALDRIAEQMGQMNPYEFSIEVSDILRSFVTEQYGLPFTRQTSVEFLERVARNSQFVAEERALLEDFLTRCDLIKFARYDATSADSSLLLDEARRFVKGGEQVVAAS